jgi:hypothetical protein
MAQDLATDDAYRVQRKGGLLLRLATWGVLATISLGLAAISAHSSAPRPTAADTGSASAAEPGKVDATTRHLIEAVRTLTADREELRARVAALERNLTDVTGSIRRDADAASQHPQPQVESTSSAAGAPAADAPTSPPATPAALPAATPNVPALTPASQPLSTIQATAVAAPDSSGRSPNPATAELGVDVGGAHNFESLRTLWTSTKRSNVTLPDELYPLVLMRENDKTPGVDLRLIIGPLANAEVAAHLCAAFLAEHRYCQPVPFEGQRLSQVKPAPKAGSRSTPQLGSPNELRPPH